MIAAAASGSWAIARNGPSRWLPIHKEPGAPLASLHLSAFCDRRSLPRAVPRRALALLAKLAVQAQLSPVCRADTGVGSLGSPPINNASGGRRSPRRSPRTPSQKCRGGPFALPVMPPLLVNAATYYIACCAVRRSRGGPV